MRAYREIFLKKHHRDSNESHSVDPDFALYDRESRSNNSSSIRQAERNTQQFCQQVKQALNLALADRSVCADVTDLYVEEVTPAPDCSRLLAHVLIPERRTVPAVLAALGREGPRLRVEIASVITRKRAPELFFVPVCLESGADE